MPCLTVVVPCHNERANILRFESELLRPLEALGLDYELLAVDDGSTDASLEALRALASRFPQVRWAAHSVNRGLGAALRSGFSLARGQWIATLDADLTFDPRDLKDLWERRREGGADLVGGSPFLPGGGYRGVSWARRLPSAALNAFYRGLFGPGLTAYTTIFRLYSAELLRSLDLRSEGFEINAEIAARALLARRRVAEVPVVLSQRRCGASKLRHLRELRRHATLIARLLR